MCNNDQKNCISEVLEVILLLQKNADCGDNCLDTCDRAFLSCGVNTLNCNTRPIMLYTCCGNGTPFAMPISRSFDETTTSTVFRIEKLDGNCATFRVLNPIAEPTDGQQFLTTNSFFTMNLNCLCAIRCLLDTFVDAV